MMLGVVLSLTLGAPLPLAGQPTPPPARRPGFEECDPGWINTGVAGTRWRGCPGRLTKIKYLGGDSTRDASVCDDPDCPECRHLVYQVERK